MGIKKIHIILISASVLLCLFFGAWSMINAHALWSVAAFLLAVGLAGYGMNLVKKSKAL